jgi:branched-chain amino acid transport system substrate-binding protein
VRHVNDVGALSGRGVRVFVVDDGGDPARHRAAVQELVERRRVIAFLQNGDGLAGGSSVEYITEKRVPVIGSEGGGRWFYESPMFFPQQAHADAISHAWALGLGRYVVPRGKRAVGLIACVEAQICRDQVAQFDRNARDGGMEPVYKASASLAQPDYTAECLAARNAGVEVLSLAFEATGVQRVVTSCVRQGYRPIFSVGAAAIADRYRLDPNMEGTVAVSMIFPWIQDDTPAAAEYRAVMERYGVGRDVQTATGWTSAKLLQRAATSLPEPPTSEAVLRGLWSIKNEDLGGLTGPLTFTEDKPPPVVECWFTVIIHDRRWESPDNFRRHCR